MWIESQTEKNELVDINAQLKLLEGELTDEQARITLCEFLRYNLKFTAFILTGIRLAPYQSILINGWFNRNFCLNVLGRGCGKTFCAGIFAFLYALFNPGHHVLIVSATFRSSRRILEAIDKLAKSDSGKLLAQTFQAPMSKRGDMFYIEFGNGSKVSAVPLGNSDRLRGLRCNVLVLDEAAFISRATIETILIPFLSAASDIPEKMRIRSIEDKLIKKGLMKESERRKFDTASKMIMLSSASFTFEYLYEVYKTYLDRISRGEDEARYFVSQLSYEVIPPDLLDKSIIDEMTNGSMSEATVDREMRAKFVNGSDGYFSAVKMQACTVPDGEYPICEIVGEKGARYVLGIDPSSSSGEDSDHFAFVLLKIVKKKNGKEIGLVVHQYAIAGGNMRDHINYLLYLLTSFNIVYLVIDTSGGDNNEFINSCNNSESFKRAGIDLKSIEADFAKDDLSPLPKQIKQSYNFEIKRIVQKQMFSSSFLRSSNEYLQGCFDFQNVMFAGKITSVDGAIDHIVEDLPALIKEHEEFKDISKVDFLENQDTLMDLVKKECALIEVKSSSLGTLSYDLPSSIKRSKNFNRPRKDSYSALLLANWGLRLFLESQNVEDDQSFNTFTPMMLGRRY